jgi:selenocysteine lyase/cysteine desulfurase
MSDPLVLDPHTGLEDDVELGHQAESSEITPDVDVVELVRGHVETCLTAPDKERLLVEKCLRGEILGEKEMNVLFGAKSLILRQFKKLQKSGVLEAMTPEERDLLLLILLWDKGEYRPNTRKSMALMDGYLEQSESQEPNAQRAILLYAFYQRMLSLPEKKRNYFDSTLNLSVFSERGFSLARIFELFDKASSSNEKEDHLQILDEMIDYVEDVADGGSGSKGRLTLKKMGLSNGDIHSLRMGDVRVNLSKMKKLRELLESYGLEMRFLSLLQQALRKTEAKRSSKENDFLELVKNRFGNNFNTIVQALGELSQEPQREFVPQDSYRMKMHRAISNTIPENMSLEKNSLIDVLGHKRLLSRLSKMRKAVKSRGVQQQMNSVIGSFEKKYGIEEGFHLSGTALQDRMAHLGPDLTQIFLEKTSEDHQGYCDVGKIGQRYRRLDELKTAYDFWEREGVSSANYQIFMRLYQESVAQYLRSLGYAEEDLPIAFPCATGSVSLEALASFLPDGEVIMSDREYGGNIETINNYWNTVPSKVEYDGTEDYAERIRTQILDLKKSNGDAPMYVIMPEVSFDGTVFPIQEIGAVCREEGAVFIVDSCQSIGCKATQLGDVNLFSHHKANGLSTTAGSVLVKKKLYEEVKLSTGRDLQPKGSVKLSTLGALSHVFTEFMSESDVLVVGDPMENALLGQNQLAGIRNTEARLLDMQKLFLEIVESTPVLREKIEYVTIDPEKSPGRLSFRVKGMSSNDLMENAAAKRIKFSSLSGYGGNYEDVVRISFTHLQSDEAVLSVLVFLASQLQKKEQGEELMTRYLKGEGFNDFKDSKNLEDSKDLKEGR